MNALLRPIVNGPSAASAGPSSLGASPPLPEHAASTSAAASDVATPANSLFCIWFLLALTRVTLRLRETFLTIALSVRSEQHTSELQSRGQLVSRRLPAPPLSCTVSPSLHDALPISLRPGHRHSGHRRRCLSTQRAQAPQQATSLPPLTASFAFGSSSN